METTGLTAFHLIVETLHHILRPLWGRAFFQMGDRPSPTLAVERKPSHPHLVLDSASYFFQDNVLPSRHLFICPLLAVVQMDLYGELGAVSPGGL